jgi:proteasome accessory factor C
VSIAADQVTRILSLVPYLLAHDGVSLTEAARAFSVTPRQLKTDLLVIWMVGLPGPGQLFDVDMEAVDEEGVIHLSNVDVLHRPMRFTPDEAWALHVALQNVRALAIGGFADVVDQALTKLSGTTPAAGDVQIMVARGSDSVREVLQQALDDGVAVRFTYHGAARGSATTPEVDPERLVTRDGVAYLDGWNRALGEWRTYRLDRIDDASALDLPVTDHPAPPPGDADWLSDGEVVTLLLAPPAAWVVEYFPVRSVTPAAGGVLVELSVLDPGWLDALVLRLGGDARVMDEAAAERARRTAADALALYAALDAGAGSGPDPDSDAGSDGGDAARPSLIG